MSRLERAKFKIKHIGILSRFKAKELPFKYDIIIVLSGPEPQRSLLEQILIQEFLNFKGTVLMVRGLFKNEPDLRISESFNSINYLIGDQLQDAIIQSKLVISRSGYSTIMDLAVLGKKAFFIPTPSQKEQLYLAKRMKKLGIAPSCFQHEFTTEKLKQIENFKGFSVSKPELNLNLFRLFNSK
ncbi:glycosyltransferase [Lutibacter sp.]|uniref:glycosyltransferase n=1 Tax=Lutibacter sp. TaxID=1925666 RepID=UPI00273424F1|nr:glycosyltransferase [Lutibacter sp.]MDP3313848.1 glycosyltransferase [Lutibacter sp.]